MRRREFLGVLGGAAAAWPLAARAQQPAMPVIGFVTPAVARCIRRRLCAGFEQGLKESGYSKARTSRSNIAGPRTSSTGCRCWRAELVRRQVSVIVAVGGSSCGAGGQGGHHDYPHRLQCRRGSGQARSCRQPRSAGRQRHRGQFFRGELVAKRLEILRELVPAATRVAVLVNPANAVTAEPAVRDAQAGGARHGTANPSA